MHYWIVAVFALTQINPAVLRINLPLQNNKTKPQNENIVEYTIRVL